MAKWSAQRAANKRGQRNREIIDERGPIAKVIVGIFLWWLCFNGVVYLSQIRFHLSL